MKRRFYVVYGVWTYFFFILITERQLTLRCLNINDYNSFVCLSDVLERCKCHSVVHRCTIRWPTGEVCYLLLQNYNITRLNIQSPRTQRKCRFFRGIWWTWRCGELAEGHKEYERNRQSFFCRKEIHLLGLCTCFCKTDWKHSCFGGWISAIIFEVATFTSSCSPPSSLRSESGLGPRARLGGQKGSGWCCLMEMSSLSCSISKWMNNSENERGLMSLSFLPGFTACFGKLDLQQVSEAQNS